MVGAGPNRLRGDVAAVEDDRATIRSELSADEVHKGGFSRAVRSDQAEDVAGVDPKFETPKHLQAAERFGNPPEFENRHPRYPVRSEPEPSSPCGRSTITRTSRLPKATIRYGPTTRNDSRKTTSTAVPTTGPRADPMPPICV